MANNIETYSGKSIAQQLLGDTKLGKWLWGNNTYKDGYGIERKDASFKESANGQLIERMKNTGNNVLQTIAENFADVPMDVYQGVKSGYNKDYQGAIMSGASLILPQFLEETVKGIRRAAKASNVDFSRGGGRARTEMKKIPGNSDIVDELSDAELGYILNERSKAIEDIPKDQRVAILHGMESRGNYEISDIDIKDNSGKIGNLRPEYKDVVPGTISIARVDNLSGGLKHGISEDGYNALLIASGKPVSAGSRWLTPEKTSTVYSKYDQDLPDENFTMKADGPMESILSDRKLTTNAIKTLGLDNLSVNEAMKELRKTINQGTNDGLTRFPLIQHRPILVKPTRHIPTKHEFLFKITSDNIKDGKPIVLGDDPDIGLKQGGTLKLQSGNKITPEYARLLGRRGMPGDKEALAAAGYDSKGRPLVTFGGGSFGGAGTGASFKDGGEQVENYDYVRNTPILQSFSDAFNNARKSGLSSFIFNGKEYTTEMSDNPNYIGKKYQPLLNIREVLDKNMKVMSDSTRIEPYVGQIPGTIKRDK